jgi:hypothetical protein
MLHVWGELTPCAAMRLLDKPLTPRQTFRSQSLVTDLIGALEILILPPPPLARCGRYLACCAPTSIMMR